MTHETRSREMPRRSATHQRAKRGVRRKLRLAGLVILSLVLIVTSTGLTMYNNLQNSITEHDIATLVVESERPTGNQAPLDQKEGQALNILVLGTDREVEGSQRSDTAMIAHISADRKRVEVVSIPRDTLVTIPECALGDGTMSDVQNDAMFNSAFDTGYVDGGGVAGGAACTMRTAEELTGIYIDGFAVVNYDSFRDIVDTIGGIDMCFAEPIDDAAANIQIEAGCHQLDGDQALAVSRVRKSLGDGSDIGRISRQHQVVQAIANKIFSLNPTTDLTTFYSLLQDLTRHLDLSKGLGDIQWLSGMLYSLRSISSDDINFVTMPWEYAGPRVIPSTAAPQVWEALINDTPIPPEALNDASDTSIILEATPDEVAEFNSNVGSGVNTGE